MRNLKITSAAILTAGILTLFAACNMDAPHEHTFSEDWTTDETYHWHAATCEHTDLKSNVESHNFNENNVCIVCGYTKPHTHVFDQKVITNTYLKSEATCTNKATYYFSCLCGEKGTEYFEHGDLLKHVYHHIHKDPTCLENGFDRDECENCHSVINEEIISALEDSRIDNSNFVRVEYIESTGTQYIDTGYASKKGIITTFDCMWLGTNGGYMVGSHNVESPYGRNGGYLDIARSFWELGFGEICPNTNTYLDVVGQKVNVTFSTLSGNAYLIVDGNELLTSDDNQETSDLNVLLFQNQYALARSSASTLGRLYGASIWDKNGLLVREFIPVLRISDSKPGMYDSVTKKFYVSETNDFEYGNIMYHSFGEKRVIKEPTYCEYGIEECECSYCHKKLLKHIDKTSYKATFNIPSKAKVAIYESQDYSSIPVESTVAYSRNNETFEFSKEDAQINFKVEIEDGYELIGININGDYKNLKDMGDGIYRVTKINSDLIIDVNIGIELSLSKPSGFYDEEFGLSMTASSGTIYYTLDGSTPTKDSLVYNGEIKISDASKNPNTNSMLTTTSGGFLEDKINALGNNSNVYPYYIPGYKAPDTLIDKCTILRAVAIDGDVSSKEIIASYFVGFNKKDGYDNTSTISLVVNNDDFFSYDNGIYVMGKTYDNVDSSKQWYAPYWWWWWSNYSLSGDNSEREANLTFFNEEKEQFLQKDCGVRIHGNGSRGYVIKSLNFYARDEYDNQNYFDYDFFNNDFLPQRLTLSSGGDDYETKLYDYLMSAISDGANYSIAKMKRYCLFINGEFWGYYYLSEKSDEEYFDHYFGVDKDNLIMVKSGEIEEGNGSDINYYYQMTGFISGNDMTISENYEQALNMVDIESYIDYYASMAYIGRKGDWPGGNYALWRSREKGVSEYEDCKWRYVMFDINSGAYGQFDEDFISYISSNDAVFRHLYRNEGFRAKFDQKLVSLAKTRFKPELTNQLIDEFILKTRDQMINEYERFFGSSNTKITDTFDTKVEAIREFFNKRYAFILENYGGGEHVHSYVPNVTVEPTFTSDGEMTYNCDCGDSYTEPIPKLKYEDYAYKVEFNTDEHIKVYIYDGQNYDKDPINTLLTYSTDKKGNLLKDGEGQVNFLVVPDEGYSYNINVDGSYKNLKGKEETGLDDVYRITKIKSDLIISISSISN